MGGSESGSIVADVGRPGFDACLETCVIACEQRPKCFFVAWFVARESRGETISGLLRAAEAILPVIRSYGVFDQFAKCDGSATGLGGEPIPVAGQQGDFSGDDAELRTPGLFGNRGEAGSGRVDLLAGLIVEDEDLRGRVVLQDLPCFPDHIGQRSGGDAGFAVEGGAGIGHS